MMLCATLLCLPTILIKNKCREWSRSQLNPLHPSWVLLSLPCHCLSPAIVSLSVCLPNEAANLLCRPRVCYRSYATNLLAGVIYERHVFIVQWSLSWLIGGVDDKQHFWDSSLPKGLTSCSLGRWIGPVSGHQIWWQKKIFKFVFKVTMQLLAYQGKQQKKYAGNWKWHSSIAVGFDTYDLIRIAHCIGHPWTCLVFKHRFICGVLLYYAIFYILGFVNGRDTKDSVFHLKMRGCLLHQEQFDCWKDDDPCFDTLLRNMLMSHSLTSYLPPRHFCRLWLGRRALWRKGTSFSSQCKQEQGKAYQVVTTVVA